MGQIWQSAIFLELFGERQKDVVTVSPSFEMYWELQHL